MTAAIVLSILAWVAGYLAWTATGSVLIGALALVATTVLELVVGLFLTRKG